MSESIFLIPIFVFVLFYSVIIHECAHAISARFMGDPTAYYLGRITLNPVKHIDIFGTILLPAILIITRAPFLFGWAKPVPINPSNFRHPDRGMMLSSIAGPASNFILAIIGSAIFVLVYRMFAPSDAINFLYEAFFDPLIKINIILGIFNLIPIPPLDGSRVLRYFLPWKMKEDFDRLETFGMVIVVIIVFTGGTVFIGKILNLVTQLLNYLINI